MADWPPSSGARISAIGMNTAGSTGKSVVSGGSANAKGSWTELIAATGFAACELMLSLACDIDNRLWLTDIGIGASGSERVIVPDIHTGGGAASVCHHVVFPVCIPAGSRISARAACTSAINSLIVSGRIVGQRFDGSPGRSRVSAYGVVSASTRGTSVDPGASSNTKGGWVEITPATSAVHKALVFAVGNQNNSAPAVGLSKWLFDIGVGAAGAEQVMIPDYALTSTPSGPAAPALSPVFPVDIPEGSRLSARSQCATTDATDRLLDIVVYGIT